jgi:hypothetical protein
MKLACSPMQSRLARCPQVSRPANKSDLSALHGLSPGQSSCKGGENCSSSLGKQHWLAQSVSRQRLQEAAFIQSSLELYTKLAAPCNRRAIGVLPRCLARAVRFGEYCKRLEHNVKDFVRSLLHSNPHGRPLPECSMLSTVFCG